MSASLPEESTKNGHLHLDAFASSCNGLSPPFWSYIKIKLKYHLARKGFSLPHSSLHGATLSFLLIFISKKLQLESWGDMLFISPLAVLSRAPGPQRELTGCELQAGTKGRHPCPSRSSSPIEEPSQRPGCGHSLFQELTQGRCSPVFPQHDLKPHHQGSASSPRRRAWTVSNSPGQLNASHRPDNDATGKIKGSSMLSRSQKTMPFVKQNGSLSATPMPSAQEFSDSQHILHLTPNMFWRTCLSLVSRLLGFEMSIKQS